MGAIEFLTDVATSTAYVSIMLGTLGDQEMFT